MNLNALAAVIGELTPACQYPKEYFLQRGCFVDARGPLEIEGSSTWGFGVKVLTQSHAIINGDIGEVIARPVIVKRNAWIGSFALLYNCVIGEEAIVAAGSVVRSCEVGPGVMVAGNPAQVIARHVNGKWEYIEDKWKVLR